MNHDSMPLTQEETFRLYEQSELFDIINDDKPLYKRIRKLKRIKKRFPVLYMLVTAGALAGAVSFITFQRKYKLF